MSARKLEGLTTRRGGWVQYRGEHHHRVFYATELYHDASECCDTTMPCFGNLSNSGTYLCDDRKVEVEISRVGCDGRESSRHWMRVTPKDDSEWKPDIQAFKTYEALQDLLGGYGWIKWLGPPTSTVYRSQSLEAMDGLVTRRGVWCQYQEESEEERKCYSEFYHSWSSQCGLSKSCFAAWPNNCGATSEGDPVITTTKEKYCHHIRVAPQWDDSWEGEQAEESLWELQLRVIGDTGVPESANLFKTHPSYEYKILQKSKDRQVLWFVLANTRQLELPNGELLCFLVS